MEPMLRFKADDGSNFPDWEEITLGDMCVFVRNGYTYSSDGSRNHRYKLTRIESISGGVIDDEKLGSSDEIDPRYRLADGDILFSNINSLSYLGNVARYTNDLGEIYHGMNLLCIRPRANEINSIFLFELLGTSRIRRYEITHAKAAVNQCSLPPSDVKAMSLYCPALPEQRKIADLLSAIDDVIAAQEAEVAAWEKRKKGVMQKLFSQEVRFKADDGSDFPDWEEKTLGDICMYERQRSEGANFVGTENMLKDFGGVTFDNSNADDSGTLYHPGDTLMSNIRPYLKKAWLADRKGTCSTDVLVFHPTSVEPGYLYWLIASDAFVRYVMSAAKGSKMPRGDKKNIMEMPLLLPNKDEQRKIDDCLSSLNDVIIKAKNELAKWQELKKGLLQQMFV